MPGPESWIVIIILSPWLPSHENEVASTISRSHRLMGVDDDVEKHALELVKIRHRLGQIWLQIGHHMNVVHLELVRA